MSPNEIGIMIRKMVAEAEGNLHMIICACEAGLALAGYYSAKENAESYTGLEWKLHNELDETKAALKKAYEEVHIPIEDWLKSSNK